VRAREHGIELGLGEPGPLNAITDVAGVRVGHTTLTRGHGALRVGEGPVRTGVTVIVPGDGEISEEPLFAGFHRLNGNGEVTGLQWIAESGLLTSPVALTTTHSVGVVRDALAQREIRARGPGKLFWSLPVVGETWDGCLSDCRGQHVTAEHVFAALEAAAGGPLPEGNVGGGTGMICHDFKGGCGTASRLAACGDERFTVGVLVQANHGWRAGFRVNGVPVGQLLSGREVPIPVTPEGQKPQGAGSIVVVVATDAPLLPWQLTALAQRAGLGIARLGAYGDIGSGDFMIAFSTRPTGIVLTGETGEGPVTYPVELLSPAYLDPLFEAAVESTEEAVLNAMLRAETMTGRDDVTAHALDGEVLAGLLRRYDRLRFRP
jgi:D-aminopeptidase